MYQYSPTRFMLPTSHYDKEKADRAVNFIQCLRHTKGEFYNKPFMLLGWQETVIRDLFGVVKEDGTRQFRTAYVETAKKSGKTELAAAIALYLLCADGEQRAEVYGAAADRQQASLVYAVAADMVRICPALNKRLRILDSRKRLVYEPTNSFYQVLSADANNKHGFNVHGCISRVEQLCIVRLYGAKNGGCSCICHIRHGMHIQRDSQPPCAVLPALHADIALIAAPQQVKAQPVFYFSHIRSLLSENA